MPLTFAEIGNKHCINKLTGNPEVRRHLSELGLIPGELVTVVSDTGGNLILAVKDSRIALDKNLAHHIHVSAGG